MTLSDTEKLNCLRLIMTENIGPVTYNELISYYGTATRAVEHLPDLGKMGGRRKQLDLVPESKALRQMELADKKQVRILFRSDKDYPENLRQLSDSAPVLFVRGNTDIFTKKAVAIVGTRNASANGKALARQIAADLAKADYNVVSGLAHGIDRAAHVGALSAEKNLTTTAVLGTPVDEVYPETNRDVYDLILERGCLISEFPFLTPLNARNFPRRNRIIAGLGEGTLVIEAQERSGSLITAREAAHFGREVFAVPGSPVDPRSTGPNALIRDGATLVSSAQDVIDALESLNHFTLRPEVNTSIAQEELLDEDALKDARDLVCHSLGTDPISVDLLIQDTGLDARAVNIVLVELAVAGRLERHPGNRVSLIYPLE